MIPQILVTKSATYAAKRGGSTIATVKEITDLAEGAIAIFNDAGKVIDPAAAATDLADQKRLRIAVGGSTALLTKLSKTIVRENVNYNYKTYSPPVKQRLFIGDDATGAFDLNLPTTLVVGTVLGIVIKSVKDGNLNLVTNARFSYEYKVKSGDTKASIAASIAALINAETERIVNATVIGTTYTGIRLDAVNFDDIIGVQVTGILSNAPIKTAYGVNGTYSANAFAMYEGSGTYAQVLQAEKDAMFFEGKSSINFLETDMFSFAPVADAASTYVIYTINWQYTKRYPASSQPAVEQYLQIAVPTSGTQIANLNTIFALAFDSIVETGDAESLEAFS